MKRSKFDNSGCTTVKLWDFMLDKKFLEVAKLKYNKIT
jgi:hypothetical protein